MKSCCGTEGLDPAAALCLSGCPCATGPTGLHTDKTEMQGLKDMLGLGGHPTPIPAACIPVDPRQRRGSLRGP